MDWPERLNRSLGRMPLGQGTVEWLQWAYAKHLPDNRPHRHTFFEVCLVGGHGQGRFIVQEREHEIGPGDLFVARPGIVHQIVNTGRPRMELFWVCFQWTPPAFDQGTPGDTDRLLRAFAESPALVAGDAQGRLAAVWQALRAVAEAPLDFGGEMQLAALATALILGMAQAGSEPGLRPSEEPPGPEESDRTARLAVRFIHDNLSRPLPLAEIAAQVSVSPRHLGRLFARFTGAAPARYITRARMDRARGLLLHSELPIKEVAATVGYPDVHHFTRAFAAHFGCPPGALRKHPEYAPVPNIQKHGELV